MQWTESNPKTKTHILVDRGKIIGTVVLTPKTGDWCASTHKRYLGRYMLLETAKAKVEEQARAELAENPIDILPEKKLILPDEW